MIETLIQSPVARAQARRPRLGFVGLGWIGRNRMEALARSGLADIGALLEPEDSARLHAAVMVENAPTVASFDELLALGLDGVVIATPNALHATQAVAALEAGCAVFCQKPLGRNAAETRRVIDAARAANRLLHVDLSYRFTRAMQQIRELIRRGALGRIYAIEAAFHNAYGPAKSWFYDADQAGGGCLLDLGTHLVDLVFWTLDSPATANVLTCLLNGGSHARPTQSVESYAAAQLLLGQNISVQLACSWHAPAGCDARIEFTVFGTEGGAEFRNINGSFYDFTATHLRPDRTRQSLASAPDDWGGRAALAWCQQLAGSPGYDPTVESIGVVADTVDRLYGRLP